MVAILQEYLRLKWNLQYKLYLVPPFSEQYVCKDIYNLPKSCPDRLYREECAVLEYEELPQYCKPEAAEVTWEKYETMEASTRKQSQCQGKVM